MRNARLLTLHAGLRSVLFPIPVITLFWKDRIGLTLTDIMVLQSIFAAGVVALEFPSGYLADRIGYRRSLAIGALAWIPGWAAYALATTFTTLVVAELALAAGLAFASGADSALLYASLEAHARAHEYARWEGRLRAAAQIAEAASSTVGGYLYTVAPRLPFWLQVPTAVAILGVTVALREPRAPDHAPRERTSHLAHALHVLRTALWHRPRLATAILLAVVLGLATFVMVWLIQPYMQERGVPEAWFGPIWAGMNLWVGVMALASHRVAATLGTRPTLLGCSLLVGAGYGLLAVTEASWGCAFYLLLMTLRGIQGPILAGVMQRDAPAADRAGVLSLHSMLFRLAFIPVGPLSGAIVDRMGMTAGLVLLGAALMALALAALALFHRAHRGAP